MYSGRERSRARARALVLHTGGDAEPVKKWGDGMSDDSARGNNPKLWSKLLEQLDEKLQLALLDRLRRAETYHFEGETLFLEAGSENDEHYLQRPITLQQLELLAQDATGVSEVKIKPKRV